MAPKIGAYQEPSRTQNNSSPLRPGLEDARRFHSAIRRLRRSATACRGRAGDRSRGRPLLPPACADDLVPAVQWRNAMKIAFALIPERGHVNPYIGPAEAMVEAGHEVVIGATGDICEQITRAGLTFRTDLIPDRPADRVTRGAELVDLIQDAARLDGWIEQLLLGGLDEYVAALRAWYGREHADVVVVDPLFYAAAIAAHLASLPWAAVSNSLNPVIPPSLSSALLRTDRRLSQRRDEMFRSYGFECSFSGPDVLSPHLTMAFATEAFVGEPPDGVALVGPSFPLRDRGDEIAA